MYLGPGGRSTTVCVRTDRKVHSRACVLLCMLYLNLLKKETTIKKNRFIYQYGEGNGNPLQCSCLENPRDRGAWWAAICGVAQSRT